MPNDPQSTNDAELNAAIQTVTRAGYTIGGPPADPVYQAFRNDAIVGDVTAGTEGTCISCPNRVVLRERAENAEKSDEFHADAMAKWQRWALKMLQDRGLYRPDSLELPDDEEARAKLSEWLTPQLQAPAKPHPATSLSDAIDVITRELKRQLAVAKDACESLRADRDAARAEVEQLKADLALSVDWAMHVETAIRHLFFVAKQDAGKETP
jgi:hypothetical protein